MNKIQSPDNGSINPKNLHCLEECPLGPSMKCFLGYARNSGF